jgi:hypothetical protein
VQARAKDIMHGSRSNYAPESLNLEGRLKKALLKQRYVGSAPSFNGCKTEKMELGSTDSGYPEPFSAFQQHLKTAEEGGMRHTERPALKLMTRASSSSESTKKTLYVAGAIVLCLRVQCDTR